RRRRRRGEEGEEEEEEEKEEKEEEEEEEDVEEDEEEEEEEKKKINKRRGTVRSAEALELLLYTGASTEHPSAGRSRQSLCFEGVVEERRSGVPESPSRV
ncbi:hypothetical protein PoB_002947500, partial [Plakobranchus ocellatus]